MEKLDEVLECYDMEHKHIFRGRKMLMFEDVQGKLYGITETSLTPKRLEKEYQVKKYLMAHRFPNVDQLIPNKNGMFQTEDKYHTSFLVKYYFNGRECEVSSLAEVNQAANNLAAFHKASMGLEPYLKEWERKEWEKQKELRLQELEELVENENEMVPISWKREELSYYPEEESYEKNGISFLHSLFEKRNKELKRIYSYMKKPGRKGEFVDAYNKCSDIFLREGIQTCKTLEQLGQKMWQEGKPMTCGLCHGSYQHHNILRCGNEWATVGMERFRFGIQMEDLYDFLRKVLEKNEYSNEFAEAVLSGYQEVIPLTSNDFFFLYMMLCYPEKFWKVSNHYFNSKKTWVPPKTIEKLNNVVKQNQEKQHFLLNFQEHYIDSPQ